MPEYGSPPNLTQQESIPIEAPVHSQTIEVSAHPRRVEASSQRRDPNGKKRKRRVHPDPEFRSRGLRPVDATPEHHSSPPNWTQQESSASVRPQTMSSHSQTIEVSAHPRAVEASSQRQNPNGKKRKRRVKHPNALEYETEDRPRDALLRRKLRWLYLRQFNTEGLEQIISEVHGTNDDTSYTFSSNRTHALDTCRGWKSKSLSKMVVSFIFTFHSFTYNSNQ
jgi:hypothetical protein